MDEKRIENMQILNESRKAMTGTDEDKRGRPSPDRIRC